MSLNKKDIENLLKLERVDGSNLPLIFDYKLWGYEEAFNYLLGVFELHVGEDVTAICLNNEIVLYQECPELFEYLEAEKYFMRKVWEHAECPERNSPEFYVDWATNLGYPIDWLHLARDNSYLKAPSVPKNLEEDLTTKERTSYSVIIAALAKAAKIDIQNHSKAAMVIIGYADDLGVKLSPNNVSDKLKLIPDALERAKKI